MSYARGLAESHPVMEPTELIRLEEVISPNELEFNLISHVEILRSSVIEVTDPNFNSPVGLYSERMGVLENTKKCLTCKAGPSVCPGHFGHILFNEDIIHPLMTKPLLHFMRCLCLSCKQALFSAQAIEQFVLEQGQSAAITGMARVEAIAAYITKKFASGVCSRTNPATGRPCMTLISKLAIDGTNLTVAVAEAVQKPHKQKPKQKQKQKQTPTQKHKKQKGHVQSKRKGKNDGNRDADLLKDDEGDGDGEEDEEDHNDDDEMEEDVVDADINANVNVNVNVNVNIDIEATDTDAKSRFSVRYLPPQRLLPRKVREMMEEVPESDFMALLGLSSPDPNKWPGHIVLQSLLVMPPSARPYVVMQGQKADDDLTFKYAEIIRCNNMLGDGTPRSAADRDALLETLEFHVGTLFNNTAGKARHPNHRAIKSIAERLGGKKGIIRNNCNGKRSDMTGRTVIGPDPNLELDEVGLPRAFAERLTFPVKVSPGNLAEMQDLIDHGQANYVVQHETVRRASSCGPPDVLNPAANLTVKETRRNLEFFFGRREPFQPGDRVLRRSRTNGDLRPYLYALQKGRPLELRPGDRIYRWRATGAYAQEPDEVVPPAPKRLTLRVGDTVERRLRDGDLVLLNRQPTLHRGSMIAQRVKVLPGKTLRFGLSLCNSFNADFDGDEMNIFVPQSSMAVAELEGLMTIKSQFTTPQNARPVPNVCQDELLAGYLMTADGQGDRRIPACEFNNLLDWDRSDFRPHAHDAHLEHLRSVRRWVRGDDIYAEPEPEAMNTAYTLLSLLLPTTLEFVQDDVRIVQGVMLTGTLHKGVLGNRSGGLVHMLYKHYDAETAVRFLGRYSRLANRWMEQYGFSIGISDCLLSRRGLVDTVGLAAVEVEWRLHDAAEGAAAEPDPAVRERNVQNELNRMTDVGQRASAEDLRRSNRLRRIVAAGSKGSTVNIAQITTILGQQNVNGSRIQPGRKFHGRTLSYYGLWHLHAETMGVVAQAAAAGSRWLYLRFPKAFNLQGDCDVGVSIAWVALAPRDAAGPAVLHRVHTDALSTQQWADDPAVVAVRLRTPVFGAMPSGTLAGIWPSSREPCAHHINEDVVWADPPPRQRQSPDEPASAAAVRDFMHHAESRGFVSRSYIDGLTPAQFLFHAAGGREGVIDTACKTSRTGYIQRRMVKLMEDVVASHTGLVMMNQRVVSFGYGDDNIDPKEGVRVRGRIQFCDAERLADQLNAQVDYERWLCNHLLSGQAIPLPRGIPVWSHRPTDGQLMWPRIGPSAQYRDPPPVFHRDRHNDDDAYRPESPAYDAGPRADEEYRPESPAYDAGPRADEEYRPESPMYHPSSPVYDPFAPAYRPESPAYDPSCSAYDPDNPSAPVAEYRPESPEYDAPAEPAPQPFFINRDSLKRLRDAIISVSSQQSKQQHAHGVHINN